MEQKYATGRRKEQSFSGHTDLKLEESYPNRSAAGVWRTYEARKVDISSLSERNEVRKHAAGHKNIKFKDSDPEFHDDNGWSTNEETFGSSDKETVDIPLIFEELRQRHDAIVQDTIIRILERDRKDDPFENEEDSFRNGLDEFRRKNSSKIKHCFTCSEKIRVEDPANFQIGQQIAMPGEYFSRYDKKSRKQRHVYKHHMIAKGIARIEDMKVQLHVVHFKKEGDELKILDEKEKQIDLSNDTVYIVQYKYPRYSPEEIVRRAESKLPENITQDDPFKSYFLFTNNCEHFVTWCVIGGKESKQVQLLLDKFVSMTSNYGPHLGKLLSRLIVNSSDEIAKGFAKALPDLVLLGTSGIYLVYCIGMTLYHIYKFKKGDMCWSCFKETMLSLWFEIGLFGCSNADSYAIMTFGMPLLGPWKEVPSVIIITLLAVHLPWNVRKVVHAVLYPLSFDKYKLNLCQK